MYNKIIKIQEDLNKKIPIELSGEAEYKEKDEIDNLATTPINLFRPKLQNFKNLKLELVSIE